MYKIKQATNDELFQIKTEFEEENIENYYNWPDDNSYFNDNIIFIYEKNNVIMGFIMGNILFGYLEFVYTFKKYRNTGVGQQLIEYFTNIVRNNNGIGIKIVCLTKNILSFWENLDFKCGIYTKDLYSEKHNRKLRFKLFENTPNFKCDDTNNYKNVNISLYNSQNKLIIYEFNTISKYNDITLEWDLMDTFCCAISNFNGWLDIICKQTIDGVVVSEAFVWCENGDYLPREFSHEGYNVSNYMLRISSIMM